MTAKGKITAAAAFQSLAQRQPVRVLLVKTTQGDGLSIRTSLQEVLAPATRKTGVESLALLEAETRMTSGGFHRSGRQYRFRTNQGWTLWMSPAQTLILTPEDGPAVKRAHAEALKEAEERAKLAQVKAATAEELEATLTDCSPTLAVMVREELSNRQEAEEVLELVGQGQTPALAQALVAEVNLQEELDSRREAELSNQRYAVELTSQVSAQEMPETPVHLLQDELEDEVRAYVDRPEGDRHPETWAGLAPSPVPARRPEPAAEDLSDLTVALAAEDLEHVDPEEGKPEPANPPAVTLDVVTIHQGDRLYEVLEVRTDLALPPGRRDGGMARVAPCDPEDRRDPQWVNLDLLHVRAPLGSYRTEEITQRIRQTREVFTLPDGSVVVVRTILMDPLRAPRATLAVAPLGLAEPVAKLRAGEALVVDGRCLRVLDLEANGTLTLEPARWRARIVA